MAIQFHCPHGHLLQGDEAHMGMQTQCPYCGVMFLIPVADPQAMQAAYTTQYAPQSDEAQQQASYLPQEMHEIYDPTATHPGVRGFLEQVAQGEVAHEPTPEQSDSGRGVDIHAPGVDTDEPQSEGCLHIPCPNGHELETPFDMLGQEVLCPHCSAQFRLRREDSREYRVKMEKIEQERGRFWFNWAVAAAILIGGGLLVLLAMAVSR